MSKKSETKLIRHSAEFTNAAGQMPEESLAYMLMSAFGISLQTLVNISLALINAKDVRIIQLCATAGVQIRGNVVYVSANYGEVRNKYPELVIESERDKSIMDSFNFSALHVIGHILCTYSDNGLAKKILSKSGNCVMSGTFPDTDAGRINKEIFGSWTEEEKAYLAKEGLTFGQNAAGKEFLNNFFGGIEAKASKFSDKLKPITKVAPTIPNKPVEKDKEGQKEAPKTIQ